MNSFLENRPLIAGKNAVIQAPQADLRFQPLFGPGSASKPKQEAIPAAETQPDAEPRIELIENGGKVERIIVTCTCCNRIELQCKY